MRLSDPQEAFVDHTADFVLLLGGRQSGKTEAAIQRADAKAKDGETVTFITYSQPAVKEAIERLHTLSVKSGGYKAGTLQQITQTRAEYASGGEVVFFNGSSADRLRGLHPQSDREFIVDGVNHIDTDFVSVLADAPAYNGSVYATATPPTSDMPVVEELRQAGYETIPATTMSNPVNLGHRADYFKNSNLFGTQFLVDGHTFNEHVLTVVQHAEERHITCSVCDFEVRIPFVEVDADIASATQYAFGMALDCACG